MVLFAPLVGAAVILSGFAAALPTSYGSSSYGSSDSSDSSYGSSSDSSSYGSSSDSSSYGGSSYGSSDSSYGSDSSNYNSDSSYGDNTYSVESSSTMMMDSTETIDSTSTTTGYNSYQTYGYGSSYGSGSSNWGGSGYDECVNQCMAQYGGGMGGEYQATATAGTGGYSGSGSGATHTIVVGPPGSYRMVPAYIMANPGDILEWHWASDTHTVTKSSAATICNKTSDQPFASGSQDTNFVFTEMVNDTDPIYYYCGTPGHCQKGMFGVINPPTTSPGAPTSYGAMMPSMLMNDSTLSGYVAYTTNASSGSPAAGDWGNNFNMSSIPAWAQPYMAANIQYTRAVMGMNPGMVSGNGTLDLSGMSSQPMAMPVDYSVFNDASSGSAAASGSAAPAPPAPTPAGADATSAAPAVSPSSSNTSGATSVASPRFLVAAAVVLATIFAL